MAYLCFLNINKRILGQSVEKRKKERNLYFTDLNNNNDYSAKTKTLAHTCIWTINNLIYSQLKQITNRDSVAEEDNNAKQKTAGLFFGKRNVLRLDLKESRDGFCWRRRGN